MGNPGKRKWGDVVMIISEVVIGYRREVLEVGMEGCCWDGWMDGLT